jgi:hypothetical protein
MLRADKKVALDTGEKGKFTQFMLHVRSFLFSVSVIVWCVQAKREQRRAMPPASRPPRLWRGTGGARAK